MKHYNDKLRLQLFFFKSLLKDLHLHETFLKEHMKLDEKGYKNIIYKVETIISLQEQLMRTIKNKERVKSLGKNGLLAEILVIYNQLNDLYVFYKPYYNEDHLILRGINVCFTNPLYWYEKMIDSLKPNGRKPLQKNND